MQLMIVKRDGRLESFATEKIVAAVAKAGAATAEFGLEAAERLTAIVVAQLTELEHRVPHLENIQDRVETALMQARYFATARAYIVYREQHAKLRDMQRTLVDVEDAMEEYLGQRDWRVQANANQGYSLGGLILNVSG